MCHVFSWLKIGNEVYFITKDELETKEGRKLLRDTLSYGDAVGHGFAVKFFSGKDQRLDSRSHVELESKTKVPNEIIRAVKNGKFNHPVFAEHGRYVGLNLLTPSAKTRCIKEINKIPEGKPFYKEMAAILWGKYLTKNANLRLKRWRDVPKNPRKKTS